MGLAVVYGVVTSHYGCIDFDSQPGRGTEFRLYLPIFTGLPPETAVEVVEETGSLRGTETILFVEDEEMLVTSVREILTDEGYNVLTAIDGKTAIDSYRAHRDEIAIVVSDIELPGISGWEAFRKMREIDPDVGIILVSGYLDPALRDRMIQEGARGFLRKPYTARGLLRTIRETLDEMPARVKGARKPAARSPRKKR